MSGSGPVVTIAALEVIPRNSSSQDLNEIALANLRELIAHDDKLLPDWKTSLTAILKDKIPGDLSALEKLVAAGPADDSTQKA